MKYLVYGLQSSGATLFSYFLSQNRNTVGIPDLWADYWCPDCSHVKTDVVIKCVVTKGCPLEGHVERYKPDVKILFLRNLKDNKQRLLQKRWKNHNGTVDDKIKIIEKIDKRIFDFVILYENFICKKIPSEFSKDNYLFNRGKKEIVRFNFENFKWSEENINKKWGFGEIHFSKNDTIKLASRTKVFL
jgi:hypothetical protein